MDLLNEIIVLITLLIRLPPRFLRFKGKGYRGGVIKSLTMKTSFSILIFLVLLASVSALFAQQKTTVKSKPKVKVYYFHPDDRCPIDQAIEANTTKVMQTDFSKEIREGTIFFQVINTDDKSAAATVSKFDINAQALYVIKIEKGKEFQKDLTNFAFDYGQSNPGKFKARLKEEISDALK